jgi:ATP-dependent DNA ligase
MEPRPVRRAGPHAPKSVVEVQFEHFTGGRFRHGTRFFGWRPEKEGRDCTFKPVERESRPVLDLL